MSLQVNVQRLAIAGHTLLDGLRLEIAPGQVHTVMGPSGSGKSSLLAAISGTLAAGFEFIGTVVLHGRVLDGLPTEQRRVGLLFQDDLLFAHMTVRENLLFAVPPGPRTQREGAVQAALEELDMPQFADADPGTLSGGQRSRVALMRALLAKPQALLLDEPFSRLDLPLRQKMRKYVFDTVRARGVPVLMVTHDLADVADSAQLTHLTLNGDQDEHQGIGI